MKRDRIFEESERKYGDFAFDEEVAEVFDDMLARSIPFYGEQQRMVADLARANWQAGTAIYDLGCSTANTLITIARAVPHCTNLVGYDNSQPMLRRAVEAIDSAGLAPRVKARYGDLNGDLSRVDISDAGVITACWTLQFVDPPRRGELLKWAYSNLAPGGAFIVCEKVLTSQAWLHDIFVDLYHNYKRRQGYSETEIARKREALERVLVPLSIEHNTALLRGAGFETVETFFQWFNFAGFIGVKGR